MHSTTYALDSTWRPLLKDLGVCVVNVLRRAGLPDDLLHRPGLRLGADDFHQFWNGIDAELDDDLLPLRLCQYIRSETFSPPLFAALSSPNLSVAVKRIARYKQLVAPLRLDVRESDQDLTVEFIWETQESQPPDSLVLTELMFVVTFARMGTREQLCPLTVCTSQEVVNKTAFTEFLGIPILKGPGNFVSFSKADANRPFLTVNESLWNAFEPELRMRLAQLDAQVKVSQRVRLALLEALPGGGVKMQAVAKRIGMSQRSLQRHLEVEGLNYKNLLQSIRQDLSQHYLRKTELPTAEIAYLIGFEESNSFFRAFRSWTGRTPEHFRKTSRESKTIVSPTHER